MKRGVFRKFNMGFNMNSLGELAEIAQSIFSEKNNYVLATDLSSWLII